MPYIDREKFRMHIIMYQHNPLKVKLKDEEKEKFIQMLDEVPTADVQEVKHGEWIVCVNSEHWKCNQCGCRAGFWFNEENSSGGEMDMSEWLSGFCPNCGADMRKETEDE